MQSRERKPRARARSSAARVAYARNTHSPRGTPLIPPLLQLAFFPYLLAKWNSPVDCFSQPASQPGSHLATPSRHTGAPYRPVGAGYGPGNENESLFFHGPPFFILPLPARTRSRAARNSRVKGVGSSHTQVDRSAHREDLIRRKASACFSPNPPRANGKRN